MSRARKRWIMISVAAVVVAAVAFAARGRAGGGQEPEKGPDVPTIASKIADVQVVVREIGTVEPEVKVDVKSNLSGRIVSLPVRAGDVVRRGDLIARIEPDVNQAQNLLAVKSTVESSSIDLEDARSDYEAKRQLFERGLVSVEVHREAETRLRQAEQDFASASEKQRLVEASGIPIGDNPQQVVNITSPMDGVVIHRPVELGETVTGSGSFNAGTVIATVADLSTLLVEAGVNEVDIGKIHEGQDVAVTLDAFPRVRFPGAIERIAPAARLDEQVKVFDVDIRLEHLGHQLRTGMTANIEIRGDTRGGVLTVPLEAVFVRGDDEVVYVARSEPLPSDPQSAPEDGAEPTADAAPWKDDPRQLWRRWFEERPVVTGIASTTDVEIVEGLSEGEKVALADPSRPPEQGAVS